MRNTSDTLKAAIIGYGYMGEIRNLSDEKHAVLSKRGRNYIRSYFNKVNDKSISKFLPEIR